MFAVPGWSITPKTLVQEQPSTNKFQAKGTSHTKAPAPQDEGSKKRKRNQADQLQKPGINGKWQHLTRSEKGTGLLSTKRSKQHRDSSSQLETHADSSKRSKSSAKTAKSKNIAVKDLANSASLGSNEAEHPHSAAFRGEKLKEKHGHDGSEDLAAPANASRNLTPISPVPANLTPLQSKMRAKLTSARFRHLNETLYTTSSTEALELFTKSPDLFSEYHAGFSQQVRDSWPQNPVELYITTIKTRGALRSPVKSTLPLPRHKAGTCTIADLGCGDAPLARGLQGVTRKFNLELHNFDLHAPNNLVTKADISALPLSDGEADIGVFCLSLMGTNWLSFVEEAWRILRGDGKGELWVAEVKSRFGRVSARKGPGKVVENSVGKRRKTQAGKSTSVNDVEHVENSAFVETMHDEPNSASSDDTDIQPFIEAVQRRGFYLREGSVDKTNKMFVSMIFTKAGVPQAGKWKGMKWNGKEYNRVDQQKRFQGGQGRTAHGDEVDEVQEAKLLKPCVYKLR